MASRIEKLKKRFSRKRKVVNGGRNLAIMETLAVLIAVTTTGVSLAIYHNSGDIYLDRSRPGFLPDEDEISEEEEKNEEEYDFAKNGALTKEGMDDYLKNMDYIVKIIDSYEKPFGPEVLSDEHLGIVEKAVPDGTEGKTAEDSTGIEGAK